MMNVISPETAPEEVVEEMKASVQRLGKDLLDAATKLSQQEARYLVDVYYQVQNDRIRAAHQKRQADDAEEPNAFVDWSAKQYHVLETQIKRALHQYAKHHPVGQWAMGQVGIGPVIAAGLLAHIDIRKAQTVGAIWRFAGLDNTVIWASEKDVKAWLKDKPVSEQTLIEAAEHFGRSAEFLVKIATTTAKGKPRKLTSENMVKALMRRPWNTRLKVLCWKASESFVKVQNREGAYYGVVYARRKALEQKRNEAGEYADQAAHKLATTRIGKDTEAYTHYSEGRLPPGHIHARAERYAVKLFLSHLHEVWYEHEFGRKPPLPYPIAHLGHAHQLPVPE